MTTTSATKHTPGLCQHRNVDAVDAGVGFCVDCEARFLRCADGSVNTAGPDLRAAPDLLEALRSLIPFVCAGAADHEVAIARAAIARAEGRA